MSNRRSTIQRKLILEELQRTHSHVTAVELYQIVRHRLPRLSLGTVYRNLEILHGEGLVKKLKGPQREYRFDAVTENHYHLHCGNCGRIEDVGIPVTVRVEGNLTSAQGWEVTEPQVEFHGLCPECRARSSQEVPTVSQEF